MKLIEQFDKLLNEANQMSEDKIDRACSLLLGAYLRGTLHRIKDSVLARVELCKIVNEAILNFPYKENC